MGKNVNDNDETCEITCSSNLTGEKTAEVVGRLHHCPVPGNVAHGGERVEHLRPRDPGHAVHAERGEVLLGELVDERLVLLRVEEGVKDAPVLEQGNLRLGRLSELQHDI